MQPLPRLYLVALSYTHHAIFGAVGVYTGGVSYEKLIDDVAGVLRLRIEK